jgi:hypothetical protein
MKVRLTEVINTLKFNPDSAKTNILNNKDVFDSWLEIYVKAKSFKYPMETKNKEYWDDVIYNWENFWRIKSDTYLGGVYDPFTTEMDFLVIINTNENEPYTHTWSEYNKVFKGYFTLPPGPGEKILCEAWLATHDELPFHGYDKFHASTSKTTLLYSIPQVKMVYGIK